MNRADLQSLSRVRLRESKALFKLKHYSGAYYLAGYAVECALKACIARQTERYEFPEKERVRKSYSHNIRELLQVAGLSLFLQHDVDGRPALGASWDEVNNWSEQSRYVQSTRAEALTLIEAISQRPDGVLLWIKQHW